MLKASPDGRQKWCFFTFFSVVRNVRRAHNNIIALDVTKLSLWTSRSSKYGNATQVDTADDIIARPYFFPEPQGATPILGVSSLHSPFIPMQRCFSMRRFPGTYSIAIAMSLCSIASVHQADASDHLNAIIQAMPANSWYTVPNSKLHGDPAEALESEFPDIWQGNGRGSDGRFAWSGGALDTKRDRLVIWGGGHADYYGNELYAFYLGPANGSLPGM